MFKKKISVVLLCFCLLSITTACSMKQIMTISKGPNSNILYKTDESKGIKYTISTNKMIDTYIIASALYMDFNSNTLMPNVENHPIYKEAKEFFSPYKNHDFLKNFNKYVYNGDINGDAIGVLLSYSGTPSLEKICEVDKKYRKYIFKDDKEIELFIKGLRSFYNDTKANEFFKNKAFSNNVKKYIEENIKESKLIELIKSMEEYLNTKDKYFGDLPIEYETVLTIYRPSMASFYSYKTKSTNKIVSFQSPNDISRNPYKLDIRNMVENVIHEYIHSYINEPIYNITISKCKDISKYYTKIINDNMYSNMPLYRQLDEYIVRAIEGRIYAHKFDEEYTFDKLLNKEIKFGGFNRLGEIYELLKIYEKENENKTIDDFLPQLVEKLARRVD
ncbi:hypothetical protein PV797_17850 [Clostridiaceae bacterium M8S5]|nr:hypothetical protein PV797_17850 [Clostridiaceae bacterium M8S5]